MNFGFSRVNAPSYVMTQDPFFDRFGELWADIGGQLVVYEGTTPLLVIDYPQHPSGTRRFELSYDPISQTAGFWDNGSPVAPRMPLSRTLEIQGAGMEILNPNGPFGSMEIDNFEVRREPALARDGFVGAALAGATDDLDGRVTAFGDRTWQASNAQVVNSVVVPTLPSNPALATVPLPEAILDNVMEVSATIGQATGNNWTAIGFADRPAAAFVTSGQVWMLLTSNQWKVKVGPTLIATGSLLGAAPHRARLRYDPLSRTITALVDDIVVVDGFDVDDMTSPPPITITDVGMHIKQNGGDLDDFEVRLDCQR